MKTYCIRHLAYTYLILLLSLSIGNAQDPFFIHFHSNASAYNPSLVGYNGALSLNVKRKTQWEAQGIEAFKTTYISLEESMPCSIFDHGFSFQYDEEGPGAFRTYDAAYKFASTIPWPVGHALNNFRIGASFQWTFKSINYSNFVFSDQLDARYGTTDVSGIPLQTSFEFPEDNRSLTFFTPSIGISHRIIFNTNKKKSPSLFSGFSLHNSYSLGGGAFGNVESILQNNAKIPKRWTAFVQAEFIPKFSDRYYIAIRPLIMHQRQSNLEYWEMGSRLSFSRFLTIGTFYHFNHSTSQNNNTNWFSFLVEVGDVIFDNKRIDLGFSFSSNFSGLKNHVGPILEFSFSYHLFGSPSCKLAGKSQGDDPRDCVNFIAEDKAKIYENIWYKTIHTKHQ